MDITLRIVPVRESDDHFVVSPSSLDGTYHGSIRTLTTETLLHVLEGLHLEAEYLAECRAHVESGTPSLVMTQSNAFEEAVAEVDAKE